MSTSAAPAAPAAAPAAATPPTAPVAPPAPVAPVVPAVVPDPAAAVPPVVPPVVPVPDPAAVPPAKVDLTLPKDSPLDPKVLEDAGALASAAQLPPETAQKVVDLMHQVATTHAAKAAEKAVADHQQAQVRGGAVWETRNAEYKAAALQDAELGNGDPAKLAIASALGQRALATFFPIEMIDLITEAGLESHPGLLKGLVRIGKSMKEDEFIAAPANTLNEKKRTADILYGDPPKKA